MFLVYGRWLTNHVWRGRKGVTLSMRSVSSVGKSASGRSSTIPAQVGRKDPTCEREFFRAPKQVRNRLFDGALQDFWGGS